MQNRLCFSDRTGRKRKGLACSLRLLMIAELVQLIVFSEIDCELKTSIFIIARFDVTCCKIVNDDSSFFFKFYIHNYVINIFLIFFGHF